MSESERMVLSMSGESRLERYRKCRSCVRCFRRSRWTNRRYWGGIGRGSFARSPKVCKVGKNGSSSSRTGNSSCTISTRGGRQKRISLIVVILESAYAMWGIIAMGNQH